MKIKEITSKYNMTLKTIAERFGIPYRTVQNWNAGVNQCPDYVLRMIDEIIEKENRTMTKYVFERYADNGGYGEEVIFDSKETASKYIEKEWAGLTAREQEKMDVFMVYEIEITEKDLTAYNDGELDSPLTEYEKDIIIDKLA